MSRKGGSNAGCFIVAVVIGALVLLGGIFGFYLLAKVRVVESHEAVAISKMPEPAVAYAGSSDPQGGMVFTEAARPMLSVPAPGEPVTLKIFAAYMIDDNATELAKDSFRKVADEAEVSWRMRLRQLTNRGGSLRGEFDVPWQIRHGHGSSGSSFAVGVEFEEAGREALLELRRGDWVTVEGQLSLAGGSATIENAVVAGAGVAEKQ
jgi:hypothetical protein